MTSLTKPTDGAPALCRCCRRRPPMPIGTRKSDPMDLCKACWDDPENELTKCKHGEG